MRLLKAFETLTCELLKACSLKLPDLNLPFIIQTDASDTGIGAVLIQYHDKIRYPVWFYSRLLNSAEINYSVSERECLGVIEVLCLLVDDFNRSRETYLAIIVSLIQVETYNFTVTNS